MISIERKEYYISRFRRFYSVLKNDCYRFVIEARGCGSVFAGGVGKNRKSNTATKNTER